MNRFFWPALLACALPMWILADGQWVPEQSTRNSVATAFLGITVRNGGATQAILYFDYFASGETATVKFRWRAKYPIRARTFQSRVYE